MKMSLKQFCWVFALTFLTINVNAQISVTANNSAAQLANQLGGQGVSISNPTLVCPTNAPGTFVSTSGVGIGNGIVLTTGRISDIPQAASVLASIDNGGGSYAPLTTLANSTTFNSCRLEFDIVPSGNILTFRYVFSSEEYPEYVCSAFNDVFAFFISGANPFGGNYTNKNIAIVPGSSPELPVAINTINPGVPGSEATISCQSLAYSSLYVNNASSSVIVYDGSTIVLTAQVAVVPCSTYRLILAIADAGDWRLDSGVFLEANSFVSNPASITASKYLLLLEQILLKVV